MSIDLALSVAEQFRLNQKEAKQVVARIQRSVAQWKEYAGKFGITNAGLGQMEPAFSTEGKN